MHLRLRKSPAAAIALGLLAALLPAPAIADPEDPLAAEIDRWLAVAQSRPETDSFWVQIKESQLPELERGREDLRGGRRLSALQHLSKARTDLAAGVYLMDRPADERKEMAAFEAAWKRLEGELGAPAPGALDGLPAPVRALGEAALPQVRVYYQASLDYAHSMTPGAGFFYLGSALAQRDLVAFYKKLPAPSPRQSAPPIRSIRPEIDALEAEMLAVYKPPVSIDRHSEFIVASGTLKEARELDAAGLRYGALLRYLQAALQLAPLRAAPPTPLEAGALDSRLRELAERLSAGGVDHGIGRLFLEAAWSEAARTAPGSAAAAASLATDVLPRYFAALEPARPQPPRPEPRVTVTLVRWPYT